MKLMMRKVKTVLMATMVFGLTAGLAACGPTEETEVEDVQTEETTTDEHPAAETDEHPAAETDEHPS
jgi:ABC-type oligopeptide transport system substrate-binding subunit